MYLEVFEILYNASATELEHLNAKLWHAERCEMLIIGKNIYIFTIFRR